MLVARVVADPPAMGTDTIAQSAFGYPVFGAAAVSCGAACIFGRQPIRIGSLGFRKSGSKVLGILIARNLFDGRKRTDIESASRGERANQEFEALVDDPNVARRRL